LEHTEYTGIEVEPSIRLQHDLNANSMIWSAISRAVRTPSRIDRAIRQPSAGPAVLVGNPNFESESMIAYEIGFRGQIARRLVGSIAAFYNDYGKIRSVGITPETFLPFVVGNDLEGHSHGVELTFNAEVVPYIRVNGGYTFLQTDLSVRPGGVDINNGLNETADPEHQFSVGSSMDLPWGVEFDAHLRWVDTLIVNSGGGVPGTVPSYTEVDLRVGVQLSTNVELALVGQNLLNDHHPETGAPGENRVEISRSVFAKLALRF
jgi:iron complex outermembrane receptor protein